MVSVLLLETSILFRSTAKTFVFSRIFQTSDLARVENPFSFSPSTVLLTLIFLLFPGSMHVIATQTSHPSQCKSLPGSSNLSGYAHLHPPSVAVKLFAFPVGGDADAYYKSLKKSDFFYTHFASHFFLIASRFFFLITSQFSRFALVL